MNESDSTVDQIRYVVSGGWGGNPQASPNVNSDDTFTLVQVVKGSCTITINSELVERFYVSSPDTKLNPNNPLLVYTCPKELADSDACSLFFTTVSSSGSDTGSGLIPLTWNVSGPFPDMLTSPGCLNFNYRDNITSNFDRGLTQCSTVCGYPALYQAGDKNLQGTYCISPLSVKPLPGQLSESGLGTLESGRSRTGPIMEPACAVQIGLNDVLDFTGQAVDLVGQLINRFTTTSANLSAGGMSQLCNYLQLNMIMFHDTTFHDIYVSYSQMDENVILEFYAYYCKSNMSTLVGTSVKISTMKFYASPGSSGYGSTSVRVPNPNAYESDTIDTSGTWSFIGLYVVRSDENSGGIQLDIDVRTSYYKKADTDGYGIGLLVDNYFGPYKVEFNITYRVVPRAYNRSLFASNMQPPVTAEIYRYVKLLIQYFGGGGESMTITRHELDTLSKTNLIFNSLKELTYGLKLGSIVGQETHVDAPSANEVKAMVALPPSITASARSFFRGIGRKLHHSVHHTSNSLKHIGHEVSHHASGELHRAVKEAGHDAIKDGTEAAMVGGAAAMMADGRQTYVSAAPRLFYKGAYCSGRNGEVEELKRAGYTNHTIAAKCSLDKHEVKELCKDVVKDHDPPNLQDHEMSNCNVLQKHGMTAREIARTLSLSSTSVSKYISDVPIEIITSPPDEQVSDDVDIAAEVRLMKAKGYTVKTICDNLEISRELVSEILEDFKMEKQPPPGEYSSDNVAEILGLHDSGMTTKKIANILKLSVLDVHDVVSNASYEGSPKMSEARCSGYVATPVVFQPVPTTEIYRPERKEELKCIHIKQNPVGNCCCACLFPPTINVSVMRCSDPVLLSNNRYKLDDPDFTNHTSRLIIPVIDRDVPDSDDKLANFILNDSRRRTLFHNNQLDSLSPSEMATMTRFYNINDGEGMISRANCSPIGFDVFGMILTAIGVVASFITCCVKRAYASALGKEPNLGETRKMSVAIRSANCSGREAYFDNELDDDDDSIDVGAPHYLESPASEEPLAQQGTKSEVSEQSEQLDYVESQATDYDSSQAIGVTRMVDALSGISNQPEFIKAMVQLCSHQSATYVSTLVTGVELYCPVNVEDNSRLAQMLTNIQSSRPLRALPCLKDPVGSANFPCVMTMPDDSSKIQVCCLLVSRSIFLIHGSDDPDTFYHPIIKSARRTIGIRMHVAFDLESDSGQLMSDIVGMLTCLESRSNLVGDFYCRIHTSIAASRSSLRGPSFLLALTCALMGLPCGPLMTGKVDSSGYILGVGEIEKKILAFTDQDRVNGLSWMLVPAQTKTDLISVAEQATAEGSSWSRSIAEQIDANIVAYNKLNFSQIKTPILPFNNISEIVNFHLMGVNFSRHTEFEAKVGLRNFYIKKLTDIATRIASISSEVTRVSEAKKLVSSLKHNKLFQYLSSLQSGKSKMMPESMKKLPMQVNQAQDDTSAYRTDKENLGKLFAAANEKNWKICLKGGVALHLSQINSYLQRQGETTAFTKMNAEQRSRFLEGELKIYRLSSSPRPLFLFFPKFDKNVVIKSKKVEKQQNKARLIQEIGDDLF